MNYFLTKSSLIKDLIFNGFMAVFTSFLLVIILLKKFDVFITFIGVSTAIFWIVNFVLEIVNYIKDYK